MAEEKPEELTIDQLKKKDKDATTLLIVLAITYSVCLIGFLIFKPLMVGIFLPLFLVTGLPIVLGRKKVREEWKKRENIV
ncbi:MAG: hypothetical protein NT144_00260 [Bacteroidia bacterium]|nr:hypothetical protein [Bacteroidia bacterium]